MVDCRWAARKAMLKNDVHLKEEKIRTSVDQTMLDTLPLRRWKDFASFVSLV